MFEYFYNRAYMLFAMVAFMIVFGLVGFFNLPKNLYPDAERPQAIVISQVPGSSANLSAATVSKPIEEEMARLSEVRDVSSVSVAGYSIVKVEFEYSKGLNAALTDVSNALSVVKPSLPFGVNPAVYGAGSFTLPVEVLSISPKENSSITLSETRKIIDGIIKPKLLASGKFGNIEVFGGYNQAIKIEINPQKVQSYGLDIQTIINTISSLNKDTPFGFEKSQNNFMTLTFYGEQSNITRLEQTNIAPNITLKDVAKLSWSNQERMSGFWGNGKNSIALAIQRTPGGSVLDVSNSARESIKELQTLYPKLNFEVVDTQRELIKTANENMIGAVKEAVIFTLLVVLFFLGNLRAIVAAGVSIPVVFLGTIGVIYLFGGELNIVVYTAIILAMGMLVDDAVVVLENIERHLGIEKDFDEAIKKGTKEVVGPIFAGTIATIAVITPLMFVGDFPQTIYRPLMSTLIIALIISYILSITLIPKFSYYLYKNGHEKNRFELFLEMLYQKSFGALMPSYIGSLEFAHKSILRKILITIGMVAILFISLKVVMPLIGKDSMPPMDTGIIKANIAFSPNDTTQNVEKKLKPFLIWLHSKEEILTSSVSFGTEPGVLSIGSGNLPTEATLTINCVNRFEREKNLWMIEDEIRKELGKIEGIGKIEVYDFGATAISSIKAPVTVRLASKDPSVLLEGAKKVQAQMQTIKGLSSTSLSWNNDQMEAILNIDTNKALSYGITPYQILMQLPLDGKIISYTSSLKSLSAQPIRIYLSDGYQSNIENLLTSTIATPKGAIALGELAKIKKEFTTAKVERTDMLYTIDVKGYRTNRAITHLTDEVNAKIATLDLQGLEVSQEGDIALLDDSFSRMTKAVLMGLALLFMALAAIYESFKLSIIMILTLPFAMIGASWGMLAFDKPSCMPSMIGILLLFGILIKNSILLIDFYKDKRKELSPYESALESVRLRYRPVMMTAFATIAGMIPIVLERAIGLEKLSPLADVAVGGLLVGTLLILFFVPMMAYSTDKNNDFLKQSNKV